MTDDITRNLIYGQLVELAKDLCEGPVPVDIYYLLAEVVDSPTFDPTKTAFDLFPDKAARQLLGESYDSVMGMNLPAQLLNAGAAYNGEMTHDFKKDNACSYFQKNELCALDGRICLYDTETFPVCPRYKEGYTRNILGLDGQKPSVPPVSEMPKPPDADQLPIKSGIPSQRSGTN